MKEPHEIALEIFDAWANDAGLYYDPIIIPSKDWAPEVAHSAYWCDLVKRFTKAIQDAEQRTVP